MGIIAGAIFGYVARNSGDPTGDGRAETTTVTVAPPQPDLSGYTPEDRVFFSLLKEGLGWDDINYANMVIRARLVCHDLKSGKMSWDEFKEAWTHPDYSEADNEFIWRAVGAAYNCAPS